MSISNEILTDFPKLECPFIRKKFKVNIDDYKKEGRGLNLRWPEVYLVTNEINPGFEWVLDSSSTIAIEKIDGTNVKIKTKEGMLTNIQNRKNIINPLEISNKNSYIVEGVFKAISKGYVFNNGEQCGEVVGPKIQGNPYGLDEHIWYPFSKAINNLKYRNIFHPYEKINFFDLDTELKAQIKSIFKAEHLWLGKEEAISFEDNIPPEGIIFYNLPRKEENKPYMAKLRRDMFPWYYSDKIQILDYEP